MAKKEDVKFDDRHVLRVRVDCRVQGQVVGPVLLEKGEKEYVIPAAHYPALKALEEPEQDMLKRLQEAYEADRREIEGYPDESMNDAGKARALAELRNKRRPEVRFKEVLRRTPRPCNSVEVIEATLPATQENQNRSLQDLLVSLLQKTEAR